MQRNEQTIQFWIKKKNNFVSASKRALSSAIAVIETPEDVKSMFLRPLLKRVLLCIKLPLKKKEI